MNYLEKIDLIGESENENECNHCKNPCTGSYCSDACKIYDNE